MVAAVSSRARFGRPLVLVKSLGGFFGRLILRATRPFRQMAFRWGVSYTATALGATVAAELALAAAAGWILFGTEVVPDVGASTAAGCASRIMDAQGHLPVGELALTQRLGGALARVQPDVLPFPLHWPGGPEPVAAVTDTNGRVLACAPGVPFAVGRPLTDQLTPEDAALVRTVAVTSSLRGGRDPDGNVVGAAPIRDGAGRRVGLVTVLLNRTITPDQLAETTAAVVLVTVPLVLLLGGLTGAVFGVVATRPLTRRLRTMTVAADAWGAGDFSAVLKERGGDEVGELARHLSAMAGQMRRHVRAQQRLATLEERNRLARDLHDTVKQQAFAAAMHLGAARTVLAEDGGPAGVFVAQAERLTNKVQEDLAALIHELRPTAGDAAERADGTTRGLPALLREEVLDWSQSSGIPADVRAEGEMDAPPEVGLALLRVTQEALANVARHSRASRVRVELARRGDGTVGLTVADDGIGFDPVFAPRGMGLSSMRDRALSLPGGQFALETSPGEGVTVRASCDSRDVAE